MHERMMDRTTQPSDADMTHWIGLPMGHEWIALRKWLEETYETIPKLDPGGKRYGWNLQYRMGGRPLCEMYPEHGSFTTLVILGKAELDQAMARIDTFGPLVRQALAETPRYHDGCWMYLRVSDTLTCHQDVQDIERLITIKRKPSGKRASTS